MMEEIMCITEEDIDKKLLLEKYMYLTLAAFVGFVIGIVSYDLICHGTLTMVQYYANLTQKSYEGGLANIGIDEIEFIVSGVMLMVETALIISIFEEADSTSKYCLILQFFAKDDLEMLMITVDVFICLSILLAKLTGVIHFNWICIFVAVLLVAIIGCAMIRKFRDNYDSIAES